MGGMMWWMMRGRRGKGTGSGSEASRPDAMSAQIALMRMGGRLARRRCGCVLLAVVINLAAPSLAAAHFKSGKLSTNFEARVGSFRPTASGLTARVLDGDQRLELRVAPPRVVIVLGLIGEPFLRFSPAGVEANLASPTASSTRVIGATYAVSSPGVRWRRVSDGHRLAWHEGRLRPAATVRHPSAQPREVATWSIPLLVDGRRTRLVGTEWYASGPSVWPWVVGGVLLVALAGFGARLLSMRMQRRIASVLLPLALAAASAAWIGTLLVDRVTWATVLFAIGFAGVTALFLLIMVAAASGLARIGVMALIAAFTVTFAMPEIGVFGHGFVLSALPASAERLAVATAVVGGIMAATICIPAVIKLLGAPPAARH
jgi:hypothetical protein